MNKPVSRRALLGLGLFAGGTLLGKGIESLPNQSAAGGTPMKYPWPLVKLDVAATQARAYRGYFRGGCMYGVFESIAGQVAEKLGAPYTQFPFAMTTYGSGGVDMWGTLCGTCNGAAMALGLLCKSKLRHKLVNQVFTWYETAELPQYLPSRPARVPQGFVMPHSVADSTLCHISITRWANKSGLDPYSGERLERCARMVADVAGFTADLLNQVTEKRAKNRPEISQTSKKCLKCHAGNKKLPNEPDVVSKMSCTTCHADAHHQDE